MKKTITKLANTKNTIIKAGTTKAETENIVFILCYLCLNRYLMECAINNIFVTTVNI